MTTARYRAVADYEVSYPHPVVLASGDRVLVKRLDPEWPAWVWVEAPANSVGWIPAQVLDRAAVGCGAVAIAPFDGRELSVRRNEILEGLHEIGGWIWCQNAQHDTGWVPLYNLAPVA
jgi:hypothetical protein